MGLKMVAFGVWAYLQSWRNLYDFLVALYSVIFVILALLTLNVPDSIVSLF